MYRDKRIGKGDPTIGQPPYRVPECAGADLEAKDDATRSVTHRFLILGATAAGTVRHRYRVHAPFSLGLGLPYW